jgi:nucleolar protein 9
MPAAVSLVNEPFASHVLRRLFIALVPGLNAFQDKQELRSKRSAGYKSKVGPMKSIFDSSIPGNAKEVPPQFETLARDALHAIRQKLSPSEVRALAADKVACPTLRVSPALSGGLSDIRLGNHGFRSDCYRVKQTGFFHG